MADFKKIFERFASAEQVTSGVQDDDDEAEGDGDDEDDVGKKDQKKAEASASESGSDGEGESGWINVYVDPIIQSFQVSLVFFECVFDDK